MSNNDERILKMKESISIKKKELDSLSKPTYETNLSLVINDQRFNLNVLGKTQLIDLLLALTSIKLAVDKEPMLKDYELSGFTVDQWIADVKSKVQIGNRKEKERELKVLEDKLTAMLSEDKKIDLQLNEIEKLI